MRHTCTLLLFNVIMLNKVENISMLHTMLKNKLHSGEVNEF